MNNLGVSQIIIEELVRLGCSQFVISPGSRSTPLTVAAARNRATTTHVHFDERGSGFFALGHARATGKPAVLICTSGTAVANYFPAIIEASMDNVPLIVLSADRPPELIGVGANQAIFQGNIYGVYPRLSLNLSPPAAQTTPNGILSTIDNIYNAATGTRPGPAHLNCQFREPLLSDLETAMEYSEAMENWKSADHNIYHSGTDPSIISGVDSVCSQLEAGLSGIIIVGRGVQSQYAESILKLAESLDWPVFPDVQSSLRFREHPNIINHFDLDLLQGEMDKHVPEVVIQFGGAFTSKRLLNHLNIAEIFYVSVKQTPERIDPNHQVDIFIQCDPNKFCALVKVPTSSTSSDWLSKWQQAEAKTLRYLKVKFNSDTQISEPTISNILSTSIPADHSLMLANSMAIREVEMFGATGFIKRQVFANRGSSGIDGLLATAAGYQSGSKSPLTVLIGDLAFLHDLNSLQLVKQSAYPMIIVLINNDGGGIFNFLPVRTETDVFEEYFGTAHGLTMEKAAGLFGLPYAQPDNLQAFSQTYERAALDGHSIIIELITNRYENHKTHQNIFKNIRDL